LYVLFALEKDDEKICNCHTYGGSTFLVRCQHCRAEGGFQNDKVADSDDSNRADTIDGNTGQCHSNMRDKATAAGGILAR